MLTIVASRTTINCAVPSSASTAHRLVSAARPGSAVTGPAITHSAAAPRTLLLAQAASARPPHSPRRFDSGTAKAAPASIDKVRTLFTVRHLRAQANRGRPCDFEATGM